MKTTAGIAALLIVASFTGITSAQEAVEDHPGYVDLNAEEIFGDVEAKMEILLDGPLLRLMLGDKDDEDGEDAEAIASIKLLRVNAFEIEDDAEDVIAKFDALGDRLTADGWSRVVHVQEDGEALNIFVRSDDDTIQGFALLMAESHEAMFVNIVGEVNPRLLTHLEGSFFDGGFDFSEIEELISEHHDDDDDDNDDDEDEA